MQIDQNSPPLITPDMPPVLEKKSSKNYLNRMDFVDQNSEQNDFLGGSRKRKGLKLALWTWAAAAVDHLIILGTTCFFVLIGTIVLQTSFKILLSYKTLGTSGICLYLGISTAYFVLFRIFLGATLGEYSCSLRLGQPMERLQNSYSARILLRTVLILGTGIIVIPVLSMIFKKDFAGQISGVSIYSLK